MIDLTHYAPHHQEELEVLLESRKWQKTRNSGLVEEVQGERIEPGKPKPFIDTVVDQLLEINAERVHELVAQGYVGEDYLFSELSRWPDNLEGKDPEFLFFGLNLISTCNFIPKCIYCNQAQVESTVDLNG